MRSQKRKRNPPQESKKSIAEPIAEASFIGKRKREINKDRRKRERIGSPPGNCGEGPSKRKNLVSRGMAVVRLDSSGDKEEEGDKGVGLTLSCLWGCAKQGRKARKSEKKSSWGRPRTCQSGTL